MLKKSAENADGRTDGRTLPRHNTSRFSNGRIKTKEIRKFVQKLSRGQEAVVDGGGDAGGGVRTGTKT